MSEPTNPPPDNESKGLSKEELEDIFHDWDARRDSVDTDDPTIDTGDDDHIEMERIEALHFVRSKAQRAVAKRLILMITMLVVAGITFVWNFEDLRYYFEDRNDIGDARAQYIQHHRPGATEADAFRPNMRHNSWLAVQGLIPTVEYQSESGRWHYFFDPILKMVVISPHGLPDKQFRTLAHGMQVMRVDPGLVSLVTGEGNHPWLYPEEAAMSGGFFQGDGRLLAADKAPRKYRGIINMYRKELALDRRLTNDQLWVFIHDETPSNQWRFVIMYIICFVLIVLSAVFFVRAKRTLAEVERDFFLVRS
jgi:hypothetical protein